MNTTIVIKVVPQAGKQKLWRDKGGTLKCALKSAPEKGKANDELISYLSSLLGIPKKAVAIVRGETDRTKTIIIEAKLSTPEVYEKLGIETQNSLI